MDIKEPILPMDGELIVGLTNFSDAGHIYYEKLTISLIHVIIRKIIGCFRSENGAENYQYMDLKNLKRFSDRNCV